MEKQLLDYNRRDEWYHQAMIVFYEYCVTASMLILI